MKFRVNNLLPLLIVLFLSAVTLWLRQAVEAPGPQTVRNSKHEPDAIVENFTMRRLSEKGKPQYFMAAKQMLHFPDSDSTELVSPVFTRTGEDGARMSVRADRGTMTHDAAEAAFSGNVILRREAGAAYPEFQAHTEFLEILAEKNVIRTDRHVEIQEGASTLSGTGMEFFKTTRQFSLHSQARGSYRAPTRK